MSEYQQRLSWSWRHVDISVLKRRRDALPERDYLRRALTVEIDKRTARQNADKPTRPDVLKVTES